MKTCAFQRRTLRALSRANFRAVQDELGRECLPHCEDSGEAEASDSPMVDDSLINGWVN